MHPIGFERIAPLLVLAGLLGSCELDQSDTNIVPEVTAADSDRGRTLIQSYGCGSCHEVPGVTGATGSVGPPLTKFARRVYVAGMLRNTPDNLTRWIMAPQEIVPGNAMPDMNVKDTEARDIAAYLYTLD